MCDAHYQILYLYCFLTGEKLISFDLHINDVIAQHLTENKILLIDKCKLLEE